MNVVLLVVDSLRACSLGRAAEGGPATPFLDRLAAQAVVFRRAHASECWTLPAHMSMFTGLVPSDHGAHFQSMAYAGSAPTLASLLGAAGAHTEIVTRNSIFDGTLPGVTRGFQANTKVLASTGGLHPLGILVALSKPRIRRLIRESGFFHALQREQRSFLGTLARLILPADREALRTTLDRMTTLRRRGTPYFLFVNCYDVHAPYPPTPHSPLRSFRTLEGWVENLMLPGVSTRLGSHAYLRKGFRFSPRVQHMLLTRYHRAIELMDAKLAEFYDAARGARLLDDTMLVVVSDHGEAFGEHALYFHDASVYQTHLHVPLYVHHPDVAPGVAHEVVSTRDLFGLIAAVGGGAGVRGTLLDPAARASRQVALAEHFHYPHVRDIQPRYAQNIAAAVVGRWKLLVRREGVWRTDLERDPAERALEPSSWHDFAAGCRREGAAAAALDAARTHLERHGLGGADRRERTTAS